MDTVIITLIMAILYFLFLIYSLNEKKLSRTLVKAVLTGVFSAILLSANLVTVIVETTNYNTPETYLSALVYVPLVEECSKLLGILLSLVLLKKLFLINKIMLLRMGGGVGLGFGIFEALSYIIAGANLQATIERLVVAVPFHISSAMLIGYGFTQATNKGGLIFVAAAVAFHSLSNLLSIYNHFLQGVIFWVLLLALYFAENFSQKTTM